MTYMQGSAVLEERPVDLSARDNETPKMWHLMDEARGDGNWTLCGLYLDPESTKRAFDVDNDCIVCEDLWDYREREGLI